MDVGNIENFAPSTERHSPKNMSPAAKKCKVEGKEISSSISYPEDLVIAGFESDENDHDSDGDDGENFYDMGNHYRGIAVIFDHMEYDEQLNLRPREGTEKDKLLLEECLKELGFAVWTYTDLTLGQIIGVLNDIRQRDHSQNDCLVVCVLTHGTQGLLYAKDIEYPREKLWEDFFTPDTCETLVDKPKLFFNQACQGTKVMLPLNETTEMDTYSTQASHLSYKIVPQFADILIYSSTYPGYVSHRNPKGSSFVRALCFILKRNAYKYPLVQILERVSKCVGQRWYANMKWSLSQQVPFIESTCFRTLLLNKKKPLEGQWPLHLQKYLEPGYHELNISKDCRNPASRSKWLEYVRLRGVRKILNFSVGETEEAYNFSVELLKRAAPLVEDVEISKAHRQHLALLANMPRLRRLKIDCAFVLYPSQYRRDLDTLPNISEHRYGLSYLDIRLPRKESIWLLRGNCETLCHVTLWVGSMGDKVTWAYSCNDLPQLLFDCELKSLKTLVLKRDFPGFHHTDDGCSNQIEQVKEKFRGLQVICSKCHTDAEVEVF